MKRATTAAPAGARGQEYLIDTGRDEALGAHCLAARGVVCVCNGGVVRRLSRDLIHTDFPGDSMSPQNLRRSLALAVTSGIAAEAYLSLCRWREWRGADEPDRVQAEFGFQYPLRVGRRLRRCDETGDWDDIPSGAVMDANLLVAGSEIATTAQILVPIDRAEEAVERQLKANWGAVSALAGAVLRSPAAGLARPEIAALLAGLDATPPAG